MWTKPDRLAWALVLLLVVLLTHSISCAETQPATSHQDAVLAFFGVSQNDTRFLSADIFDCLVEYAALPQSRKLSLAPEPDEEETLAEIERWLAEHPETVALGILIGPGEGSAYRRGPSGLYEPIASLGNESGGNKFVVGGRNIPPRVYPLDNTEEDGDSKWSEDFRSLSRARDGSVKVREMSSFMNTDKTRPLPFGGEWPASLEKGTWDDYLAGHGVLLSISGEGVQKRNAVFDKCMNSDDMKSMFGSLVISLITEGMPDNEEPDESKLAEIIKEFIEARQATVFFTDQMPMENEIVRVFVKGDVLLWHEPAPTKWMFELRNTSRKATDTHSP
jgi:hypothetical protein